LYKPWKSLKGDRFILLPAEEYDHEVPTVDPANAPEFSGVFFGAGEKKGQEACKSLRKVVGRTGLEPITN
jgi:hypothetical protein